MYISGIAIFVVAWLSMVGAFVGYGMSRTSAGGMAGAIIACVLSCVVLASFQNSEIASWQYDDVTTMREGDCRIAPFAKSILADKTISKAEYWRLQDLAAELRLRDARGRANDEAKRQCTSS
jgi:hypothetical protein